MFKGLRLVAYAFGSLLLIPVLSAAKQKAEDAKLETELFSGRLHVHSKGFTEAERSTQDWSRNS